MTGHTRSTLTMKATVAETVEEQGTFTAVISSGNIDREHDIIVPGALVSAIHKWMGRAIPLVWAHQIDVASSIIGSINPASAREEQGEVIVEGAIDRSTPQGQECWRLVKSGTISFSHGFIALTATQRPGGKGAVISKLDLFEITLCAAPANADTRVLAYKSLDTAFKSLDTDSLDDQLAALTDHALAHGHRKAFSQDLWYQFADLFK